METLKTHKHPPKLFPIHLAAIDDKEGDTAVTGAIPLDPASNDAMVRYLEPVFAVREVLDGQGAANLFNQPAKEPKQVFLGLSDDLELIASRFTAAKLERIKCNTGPEQMGAKVKLVDFSSAVDDTDRIERDVLESFEASKFGNHPVEASATEPSVATLYRAVVDDLVVWRHLAAVSAENLLACRRLGAVHFH